MESSAGTPLGWLAAAEAAALAVFVAGTAATGILLLDLVRVGVAARPWSWGQLAVVLGAPLVTAPLAVVALALTEVPFGALVDDRDVLDRVRALALDAGVRPPDEVRLDLSADTTVVRSTRGLRLRRRRVLLLGLAAMTGVDRPTGDALIRAALLRDPPEGLASAMARAVGRMVAPRPLPESFSVPPLLGCLIGTPLLIASGTLVVIGYLVPVVLAAGLGWPLVVVHRRVDALRRAAAERALAQVPGGPEGLAAWLDDAACVAALVTQEARTTSRRFAAPVDVPRHLLRRLARRAAQIGRPRPAAPWLAPTDAQLDQLGEAVAQRLGSPLRTRTTPPGRHPPLVADPIEAAGLPSLSSVRARAAALEGADQAELLGRLAPVPDQARWLRAWDDARLGLARLVGFTLVAAPTDTVSFRAEEVTPWYAEVLIDELEGARARAARALREGVTERFAAGLVLARATGPDWEGALVGALRLAAWLEELHLRLVDLRWRVGGSSAEVRAAWDEVARLLAATRMPGQPSFALGPWPTARRAATVVEAADPLIDARLEARERALDLLDALVIAERGAPCTVSPARVPAPTGPVRLRDDPGPTAQPRAVRIEPGPRHVAWAAAVLAALLGLRVVAGASRIVVYNGATAPLEVHVGEASFTLPPRGHDDRWFYRPGPVAVGFTGDEGRVDEGAVQVVATPRQWVYNAGSRGVLVERDVAVRPTGGPPPRPTRLLGVGPIVPTSADDVLPTWPSKVEQVEPRWALEDAAAGRPAEETVAWLLADSPGARWRGDGAWEDVRAEQALASGLAALALDRPGPSTTRLAQALGAIDRARTDEAVGRRRAAADRRCPPEPSYEDPASYAQACAAEAWIAPPGEGRTFLMRALAAAPEDPTATCMLGAERARELAWAEAVEDLRACRYAHPVVRAWSVELRLGAARLLGTDPPSWEATDDPRLAALVAPVPPDGADRALLARWWLGHGDPDRAASVLAGAVTAEEHDVMLIVSLSDGLDAPVEVDTARALDPVWIDVARRLRQGPPTQDREPVEVVEARTRGVEPKLHGTLYAVDAVTARGPRRAEVVRRARALATPGTIPWLEP